MNNLKIPSEFTLFSKKIKVIFENEQSSYLDILGQCSYIDGEIHICSKFKGEQVSECTQIETFYHEKVHLILDAMGEHELSANEKFVDIFSKLLKQSDETAK